MKWHNDGSTERRSSHRLKNVCRCPPHRPSSEAGYSPTSFDVVPAVPAMLSIMLFPLIIPVVAIKNFRPVKHEPPLTLCMK